MENSWCFQSPARLDPPSVTLKSIQKIMPSLFSVFLVYFSVTLNGMRQQIKNEAQKSVNKSVADALTYMVTVQLKSDMHEARQAN